MAATTFQGVSTRTCGRHRRDGLEYVPPSFGRKFREEALPSLIPRNTKALEFQGFRFIAGAGLKHLPPTAKPPQTRETAAGVTAIAHRIEESWPLGREVGGPQHLRAG